MYSRARIARVDRPRVLAGVPFVDGGFVLHAGVAAVPGALGHFLQEEVRVVFGAGLRGIGDPVRPPGLAIDDGLHELVADADGEVRVLEHDRAVGFAVEVGFVFAAVDQRAGFLFFLGLGLDELQNVGVPIFEGLHLRGPAGFAARLDHGRDLIVNPHEGQRPRRDAAAREFFAGASDGGKVGARAGAIFEEHRFAGGEPHDVFHVVLDGLNEARGALRIFVGRFGTVDHVLFGVPVVIALAAFDAVFVEQAPR